VDSQPLPPRLDDAAQPDAAAPLDPGDRALAAALGRSGDGLTREELAEQAGVPPALLEAMEREGLLAPGADGYGDDDAHAVSAGLELLQSGLPLAELLDLARRHDQAMRGVADEAVDLFVRFVRDPIRGSVDDPDEAATRMLDAFGRMLPATSALVAHHFRRRLLESARERVRREVEDSA
jgi:DNA-binding transcriptional MerR regulator